MNEFIRLTLDTGEKINVRKSSIQVIIQMVGGGCEILLSFGGVDVRENEEMILTMLDPKLH